MRLGGRTHGDHTATPAWTAWVQLAFVRNVGISSPRVCAHLSWCPSPSEHLRYLCYWVFSVSAFLCPPPPRPPPLCLFLLWGPLVLACFPVARSFSLSVPYFLHFFVPISSLFLCDCISAFLSVFLSLYLSLSLSISASLLSVCVHVSSSLFPPHLFVDTEWQQIVLTEGRGAGVPEYLGLNPCCATY